MLWKIKSSQFYSSINLDSMQAFVEEIIPINYMLTPLTSVIPPYSEPLPNLNAFAPAPKCSL